MLGSLEEAEDAVQETWLRFDRSDVGTVANARGWLTTVIARICLDMLRSRKREEVLEPDIQQIKADLPNWVDPEQETIMADSVGVALLIVLDSLSPAERLAFVLHDVFDVSFEEIARIVQRTPVAAKKLASRARLRIRGNSPPGDTDLKRQREVVAAFLAASRSGDMQALMEVLHPDAVRVADRNTLPPNAEPVIRGAKSIASETVTNAPLARLARIAIVNGMPGLIVVLRRRVRIAMILSVRDDKIIGIRVIGDRSQLKRVEITAPGY